jgi:hypothetical protein
MRRGLDDFQVSGNGFADATDVFQSFGRCRENAIEIAEGLQKPVCDGLNIATRQRPEQNQLQKLVIGHGGRATDEKAVAQPFTVITDVGRHPAPCICDDELLSFEQGQMWFVE